MTLALLLLFRLVSHIPVPGVDRVALNNFFAQNQVFGLVDLFSGGSLSTLSLAMLGVGPYITASIIFQLLGTIIPKLERYQREGGAEGRRRINQYTRLATVPLAILQTYGTIHILNSGAQPVLTNLTPFQMATVLIVATGGTMFLMWLGEIISESGIGNGVSLIIFAGIIAKLPSSLQRAFLVYDSSQLGKYVLFAVVSVIVIAAVVLITQAQRKIPVSYARRVAGNRLMGSAVSHLPLQVNQSGVMPIIFAVSVLLFPSVIANFFVSSNIDWLRHAAVQTETLFRNQWFYGVAYFLLVILFTYFYTAIAFNPEQVAENIQKSGGFIPGIRPGRPTAEYLDYLLNRITVAGALFLGVIAVLPLTVQSVLGTSAISIGGTGLLIVVSVVLETVRKIEAQMVMHDYEGF